MSNVLPFGRWGRLVPAREAAPAPSLHRGVRAFSAALAWSFTLLAALTAALLAAALLAMFLYRGEVLGIGAQGGLISFEGRLPAGYAPLGSLPLANKLVYLVVGLIRYAPKAAILLSQAALFRLYSQGVVFDRANARHLRDTGLWLVVDGLTPFLCHLALAATGYEIDRRWAHLGSLQEVVLGALLFVIAEVMKVGREIEEERSQFV
jgi:hypothetical protein